MEKQINWQLILPSECPACKGDVTFDGVHLKCNDKFCVGKIEKKLESAAKLIGLKGIGPQRIKPFAKDFTNMVELFEWVIENGDSRDIEKYDIEYKSRSHEIFLDAFKNIKSLPYEKVIQMIGYENVGKSLSKQLAIEHNGGEADYTGLERALVEFLHELNIETYIKTSVLNLESLGITVDRPVIISDNNDMQFACLTGSPKKFGFKTKKEFLEKYPNLVEVSLSDKNCEYLITDDYGSTSSKMKTAKKKNITIKTYEDF